MPSAEILSIRTLGTNFNEILNRDSYIFVQEDQFKNVVSKMAAILSRPQCVQYFDEFAQ